MPLKPWTMSPKSSVSDGRCGNLTGLTCEVLTLKYGSHLRYPPRGGRLVLALPGRASARGGTVRIAEGCALPTSPSLVRNTPRDETMSQAPCGSAAQRAHRVFFRGGLRPPEPFPASPLPCPIPIFLSGSQLLHFISTDSLCTEELRWTRVPDSPGTGSLFWLWKAGTLLHGTCTAKSCLNLPIHVL